MKKDEAPEKGHGKIAKDIEWLVKEFELYSVSNRKPFKYGDMIISLFQECYLRDVVELKWSAV